MDVCMLLPQPAGWRWCAVEPGGWTHPAVERSEPCPPALWSPSAPRPSGWGCSGPYGTCRSFSIGNTMQCNKMKAYTQLMFVKNQSSVKSIYYDTFMCIDMVWALPSTWYDCLRNNVECGGKMEETTIVSSITTSSILPCIAVFSSVSTKWLWHWQV